MSENQTDSLLAAYFYSSITDIQSTIRVIDTKVAVVIGVLVLPFTNLGKIYLNFAQLYNNTYCGSRQWMLWLLISIFFLSWLLAFIASVRAIMSIHNPVLHVKYENIPGGTFYNGNQFKPNLIDVYFTRKIKSKCKLEDYVSLTPKSIDEIKTELCFEQMKLAYIRDIKSIRLKWSYIFLVFWLSSGFLSRILYLYHCSK